MSIGGPEQLKRCLLRSEGIPLSYRETHGEREPLLRDLTGRLFVLKGNDWKFAS